MLLATTNVGDSDAGGVLCQTFDVIDVDSRDDRATRDISGRYDKCVDRKLGSCACGSEQLTSANTDAHVDGTDLDTLSTKAGKDCRVRGPASHDLREHRRNRCHWLRATANLGDQCSHAIATRRGAVR